MNTKKQIVKDWLPRYTGMQLEDFGAFILLTNFQKYIDEFAKINKVTVVGEDKNMPSATHENITIINFGMGSPNAATIMDLLVSIKPKAVLFLGKCGGLKNRIQIGDFVLPIGAIRGEGTSNDYFPIEVPAMPSFSLQRAISSALKYQKIVSPHKGLVFDLKPNSPGYVAGTSEPIMRIVPLDNLHASVLARTTER